MAAVPERQVDDLVAIRDQHERAGYESELVTGADGCREYLTWSWPDWEAPVEAVLHERRGGWADAMQTVRHLAERARAAGRRDPRGRGGHRLRAAARCVTERGPCRVRDGRGLPGAVGRAACGRCSGSSRRGDGRRAAPARDLPEGAGGRVRARGRGAQRRGGRGGAGGAPRPGRAAALGPRRERARGRPLGHLLPHGPHRHRHHGRRAAGVPGPARRWTPTARTTPSTRPSRSSRTSSSSGLATALRRFRGRSGDWRVTAAGGLLTHTPRRLPDLRLGASGRLRDRRLGPRLQDARDRQARGRATSTAASRCSSRSGSGASRRASCTRPRRGPTRGPRLAPLARQAGASARKRDWEQPGAIVKGPPITVTCECGEKRDLAYGERVALRALWPQLGHEPDPGRAVRRDPPPQPSLPRAAGGVRRR